MKTGIDKDQLRSLIKKTLLGIGLYSKDAENLLLGTAAQESALGHFLRQLKGGPAVGIFQMEPFTFDDHVDNFLRYKPELRQKIIKYCFGVNGDFLKHIGIVKEKDIDNYFKEFVFNVKHLEYNLAFACAMSRVHYLRIKSKLPSDLEGYAKYWKKHYNTYKGAGTEEEFINNYKNFKL